MRGKALETSGCKDVRLTGNDFSRAKA